MKKFLAWLLVLTMTAAMSIGATLAYLTDEDVAVVYNWDISNVEEQLGYPQCMGLLRDVQLLL